MLLIWLSILCLKLGFLLAEDGPTVTIPDGELLGTANETEGGVAYYAFRGIPYAQEPIGNLRFASPVVNDAWTETLDATQDKDVCTQLDSGNSVVGSEDCLHVNVYTTDLNGSLPVMVWIYGGGFTKGGASYSWYGPDYLLEKGVIYVAFNYRVGVFGFLSTEDSSSYGNWGLKDQVLALNWVKNNIQYFGGNPDNITIFGQSAGSASISYLLTSPLTAGLYQRAIMQSGTSLCAWGLSENARSKAFSVGTALGIVALTSATLIKELRKVDYKELKIAEANITTVALLTSNILGGLPFGVVKEKSNTNAVFTGSSYNLLLNGDFQEVDLILGYNSNELGSLVSSIDSLRLYLAQYDADNSRLTPNSLTTNLFKKLAAGVAIKNNYFGLLVATTDTEDIIYFLSNDQFNRPVRETAVLAAASTNVYLYLMDYKGSLGAENTTYSGVGHAEDLNYIFTSSNDATSEDIATREKFVTLWTNFAKYGNPTPSENDATIDSVIWEPNTPTDDTSTIIKYLYINTTLSMGTNPDEEDWAFYEDIYESYGSASNYATY